MASSEATTYIIAITCDQVKNAEDYLQKYEITWIDTAIDNDNAVISMLDLVFCIPFSKSIQLTVVKNASAI